MHLKSESISNKSLRQHNLAFLLKRFDIHAEVGFLGKNYCFNENDEEHALALCRQLDSAFELDEKGKTYFVEDLIMDAIRKAPCDELPKQCCMPLFCQELDYRLVDEALVTRLPHLAYGAMLDLLKSPYFKIVNDSVHFDVQHFLEVEDQSFAENLFILANKKNRSAHVILKSAGLEQTKIVYVRKEIDENHIEVTPYFCAPFALKPPTYHFLLDASCSMKDSLGNLKKSALVLAESLFEFQPEATIRLKTFSSAVRDYGEYGKKDFSKLKTALNDIRASGLTCLNQVTRETITEFLKSNNHNNVLLFTDGKDEIDDDKTEERKITETIANDDKSPLAYRNKFFIISYHLEQSTLMQNVARFFKSPVIDTRDPCIMNTLLDNKQLGAWAAARELFTARIEVWEDSQDSYEECFSCDLSGQFIELKSKRLSYNGTLRLEIFDGEGNRIIEREDTFVKSLPKANEVETIGSTSAGSARSRSSSIEGINNSFRFLGFGSRAESTEEAAEASTTSTLKY